ncbi:MAG: hypothetical protein RBS43_02245 [Candidatus Cloacimonas sp.]|nr:hypothetical protein [Candidatus Cloacimonas sp.]
MNEQYEHIRRIRKDKYWLDDSDRNGEKNPLLPDLQQSINTLSRDLYNKDSHFILELIQNADDNKYENENPSLSFALVTQDPNNTVDSDGALIIVNNEIGFSEADMKAMCSIGASFKDKREGYIGEKGIGFKSVFKLTRSPYIFSNNYQVRFPDKIESLGLGYIVPEWVDSVPYRIDSSRTTIVLPLNNGEFGFEKVSKMLHSFTPESILFLRKVCKIRISIENEYELIVDKSVNQPNIVDLSINILQNGESKEEMRKLLVYSKQFLKPDNVHAENREDIKSREITLVIPINDETQGGYVYAYLPVLENTGLPFILNADFIVPGSREAIKEDSQWNLWLRDQVPELFIEAFSTFIRSKEFRYKLFKYIPLASKEVFFEPIIKPIHETLANMEIVSTEPNGRFIPPIKAISSIEFRKLISDNRTPEPLIDRLISNKLQSELSKDVRKAIGIRDVNIDDIVSCLKDTGWIISIGYEGLIKVFTYLSRQENQFSSAILSECSIIPIKDRKKVRYSCDKEQAVYFEATKENINALNDAPSCIKVPIRFLDDHFYSLVNNNELLTTWMTKILRVFPFDLGKYAVDALKWFLCNYNDLSDEDFKSVTDFILVHRNKEKKIEDIPILLNKGQRELLSTIQKSDKELITPMSLDPETGWQNIFTSTVEHSNFHILSDIYITEQGKSPAIVSITNAEKYPSLIKESTYPNQISWRHWKNSSDYNDQEKSALNKASGECSRSQEINIKLQRVLMPSGLTGELTIKSVLSLIQWLNNRSKRAFWTNHIPETQSTVYWKKNSGHSILIESPISKFISNYPWFPSNRGFCKPSQMFKKTQGVWDIMGDSVPYLEYELTDPVFKYLQIRDDISNEDLVSYLLDLSKGGAGSRVLIARIYSALNSRTIDEDTRKTLAESNCIAVYKNDDVQWVSPKICVWSDRSDLFENEFYFLSNLYPKIKDFFIDVLNVASDIGDEQFCELWLDIQKREIIEIEEIEYKLSMLYYRLKPLFDSSESNSEEWWQRYLSKAMLWSSCKKFLNISQVYIPDDGILKDVFNKEQVDYLWYPKGSSYSQWESLHSAFQVRSLKKSVAITLRNMEDNSPVTPPAYLTQSTKTLILIWLMEKQRDRFNSLTDQGIVSAFIGTNEYKTRKLIMEYSLGGIIVEGTRDCYIELSEEKMHYLEAAGKTTVAAEISRTLTDNEHDEHLELWVKGALGANEKELSAELRKNNWQILDELAQLMSAHTTSSDKSDRDEPSTEDPDGHQDEAENQEEACFSDDKTDDTNGADDDRAGKSTDSSSHDDAQQHYKNRQSNSGGSSGQSSGKGANNKTNSSEGSDSEEDNEAEDSEEDTETKQSFADELFSCFNTKDKPINDDERNDHNGTSSNPNGRYEKESDRARDKHTNSRAQTDRYKEVRRRILDGPDPLVRVSLDEWYSGKCQICGSTLHQSNGETFFVSHYLVPRKVSDAADTVGNALCLCANHFAQMVYGRLKSPNIIKQLESIDPADASLEISLEIDGEDMTIKYNQKHAIALKAFYEASKVEPGE